MKKKKRFVLLFMLVNLFTSVIIHGQEMNKAKIPFVITRSFHEQYAKTCHECWKKVGRTYEVVFGMGPCCDDNKVLFDSLGKIIYQVVILKEDKFPKRVRTTILKQFSGYQVCNGERVISHGNVTYIAEFKKENETWIVAFGMDGKVLAKLPD